MKIFVLGYSGIGKSPLTEKILKTFTQAQHIRGGEWVRSKFPPNTSVEELTRYSKEQLAINPNSCIDYINSKYSFDHTLSVVEGIRNPYDFNRLFNYQIDIALFLTRTGLVSKTSFEENGLGAIKSYINFLKSEKFISDSQVVNMHFLDKNKYSTDIIEEIPQNALILNDLEDAILLIVTLVAAAVPIRSRHKTI